MYTLNCTKILQLFNFVRNFVSAELASKAHLAAGAIKFQVGCLTFIKQLN